MPGECASRAPASRAGWTSRPRRCGKQWLKRTPRFSNQPYAQLASVLRAQGKSDDAKQILIAQQEDRLHRGEDSPRTKRWLRILGATLGFGYQPWRALLWLAALLVVGSAVFSTADALGLMAPTNPPVMEEWARNRELPQKYLDYPRFGAITYSLDTLLPIIPLGVDSHWHPVLAVNQPFGRQLFAWIVWIYLRLHVMTGWAFATLAAAGFSGIVRQE